MRADGAVTSRLEGDVEVHRFAGVKRKQARAHETGWFDGDNLHRVRYRGTRDASDQQQRQPESW